MEVNFVGHAAILIEASGLRILADPWWQGPCFGSQWWIYPRPELGRLDAGPVDYIYISHGHVDHFHRGTLRRFPKGTKVLVSSEIDLAPHLADMGFEVIQVRADEERDLGNGVRVRIMPTYGADTLMALSDGREVCLNLNDALHAAPGEVVDAKIPELRLLYPKIDYVFCGYGIASHFPNCYVIPGKDKEQSAIQRQKYFNSRWADIVHRLEPVNAFPFAANVVFLDEELMWANEPVHNAERPVDAFLSRYPNSKTRVIDIAPGFLIGDGEVRADVRFEVVRNDKILSLYRDEKARKEAAVGRSNSDVGLLAERLERNIGIARDYLRDFAGDYNFLIVLRGQEDAIAMIKSGRDVFVRKLALTDVRRADYDLVATTNYSYLRRAFTTEYGDETLFVGSGIIFEYRDAARVKDNLHSELTVLFRQIDTAPRSRFGDQPRLLFAAKKFVKHLLGRKDGMLYDLRTWTVFADPPAS